jgi:hypothetical protein
MAAPPPPLLADQVPHNSVMGPTTVKEDIVVTAETVDMTVEIVETEDMTSTMVAADSLTVARNHLLHLLTMPLVIVISQDSLGANLNPQPVFR